MSEWQPIETAPKDGSEFLAYWPDFKFGRDIICQTWYNLDEWETDYESAHILSPYAPTHWTPLPAPPVTA